MSELRVPNKKMRRFLILIVEQPSRVDFQMRHYAARDEAKRLGFAEQSASTMYWGITDRGHSWLRTDTRRRDIARACSKLMEQWRQRNSILGILRECWS